MFMPVVLSAPLEVDPDPRLARSDAENACLSAQYYLQQTPPDLVQAQRLLTFIAAVFRTHKPL